MTDSRPFSAHHGRLHIINAAFQTILHTTADMMFVKDLGLRYVAASPAFVHMVGKRSVDEIIGHTDFELFDDPELARRYVADDKRLLKNGRDLVNYIEPITDEEGRARYSSTSKYILSDSCGNTVGLLGIGRDVTREYIVHQGYRQELKYLFELPENAYGFVFIDIDDRRIIGDRRREVHGVSLPSYNDIETFLAVVADSVQDNEAVADFFRSLSVKKLGSIYDSGKRDLSVEYLRRLPGRPSRWVRNEIKFLLDPSNGHRCVMFVLHDIHDRKTEELNLIRAADTDEMTGLPNRAAVMRDIRHFLEGDGANGTHALFIIDVDNFKSVNDTFGHQAGDAFLVSLAQRLRQCFREIDPVGRLGGDEFLALMKNVPDRASVEDKARNLLEAMRSVCTFDPPLDVSGSIGISFYTTDGNTLHDLYARADAALYRAKAAGKNRFDFASPSDDPLPH